MVTQKIVNRMTFAVIREDDQQNCNKVLSTMVTALFLREREISMDFIYDNMYDVFDRIENLLDLKLRGWSEGKTYDEIEGVLHIAAIFSARAIRYLKCLA